MFGIDPRHNKPYNYYMHMSGWGGGGATPGHDGEPCVGPIVVMGAAMTGDIEMVEYRVPIHIRRYELRPNSGGPGRWRGGLGALLEFDIVGHNAIFTNFCDGMKYPAPGVLGGGGPCDCERVHKKWVLRGANREPERIGLDAVLTIRRGETIVCHTAGGGGIGPAYTRDKDAVRNDVLDGYVTLDRARGEYGAVIDSDTFEIDQAATELLRKDMARCFECRG
jgi:N-methylhydantoinase B